MLYLNLYNKYSFSIYYIKLNFNCKNIKYIELKYMREGCYIIVIWSIQKKKGNLKIKKNWMYEYLLLY